MTRKREVLIVLSVKGGDTYERAYEVESKTISAMIADIYALAGWPEEFTATIQCDTVIGIERTARRAYRV